jgi:hypothetical protein
MRQAMNDQGAQFSSGIADTLAVELHDAVSPFSVAYTFNNINLYTDGTITINDIPLSISGSYYLVLKHRNSIETWSSDIINFNSSGIIRYNFTDASSKAYDNNMKLMQGNVYAVYSGDVIKDGLVDGSDLAVIDNATINILKGYRTEDINGDGLVDGSDLVIIDNNSTSIVKVHKPLLP